MLVLERAFSSDSLLYCNATGNLEWNIVPESGHARNCRTEQHTLKGQSTCLEL